MIRAVIDIGSNSIKMRIADVRENNIRVIRDETEVVRLGRGMSSTGNLSHESMNTSCDTVVRMVRKAQNSGADIFIVGTMALRTAGNSGEFVNMVRDKTGLEVHVFSGEDEAKYSWLGAVEGFSLEGDAVMFDSGGGSTEFVLGDHDGVKNIVSVPVGAVSLSERFFSAHDRPIKKAEYDSAANFIKTLFSEYTINTFRTAGKFIGVGGGVVTMASVKHACENFMPSKLHGSILTQRDILRQIRMYASLTLGERQNIIGLPASRADVILGSACIILTALRVLNARECIVSINGLRHGLLLHDVFGSA